MTRTLAAFILALASCQPVGAFTLALASGQPLGAFTLAVQSDTGIAALAWDGAQACVFHNGERTMCYAAETAAAAIWGWDEPEGDKMTSPRMFAARLTAEEISTLVVADLGTAL